MRTSPRGRDHLINEYYKQSTICRSQTLMPGGVNSPVRAFKSVGGDPLYIARAKGSKIYDVDGNEFIDYIGSWGPMILGHAQRAGDKRDQSGGGRRYKLWASSEKEIELAKLVKKFVPSVEMVRMVNSGTEATMSAMRLARGFTGRDKIIKFEGCYHGHGDSFLSKAGSGVATLGLPDSPGVTRSTAQDTLNAIYNDIASVEQLVEENAARSPPSLSSRWRGIWAACRPNRSFLKALRELCTAEGISCSFLTK